MLWHLFLFLYLATPGELVKSRRNDIMSFPCFCQDRLVINLLNSLLIIHLDHPNISDNSYNFVFLNLERRMKFLNDTNEEVKICTKMFIIACSNL